MTALLEQLTLRDWIVVAIVAVAVVTIAYAWWTWPWGKRRRAPRQRRVLPIGHHRMRALAALARPVPASWCPPPYDWARRPGARVDLGLRREPLIGRRAAISHLGLIREPPELRP